MGRLSAEKATEKEKHCGLAKALNPNRKEVAYLPCAHGSSYTRNTLLLNI